MDQRYVRNDPDSRLQSDDAVVVRASELRHTVEDIGRHVDFGLGDDRADRPLDLPIGQTENSAQLSAVSIASDEWKGRPPW
jgi:hypothetical protein